MGKTDASKARHIDTAVIGNGPAGICVSLMLSGWWPYYKGGHPDEKLHRRLAESPLSLMERDLPPLCVGLDSRSDNPVARLFDALHHPGADADRVAPTCLDMRYDPRRAVDHLVLGRGEPGGSWQDMPEGMKSLSPAYWMELPGWSLFEWGRKGSRWVDPNARIDRGLVAAYYRDYVAHMGLSDRFVYPATVTAATPGPDGWRLDYTGAGGKKEVLSARRLVLACGMYDVPKRLDIPGEALPFVTHRMPVGDKGTLLVVGSGLSAADAILTAREEGRPVIHAFIDDAEATLLNRLNRAFYPDYSWLSDAMEGEVKANGYTPLPRTWLDRIDPDGTCHLDGPRGTSRRRVDQVAVLIGSRPDLSFLKEDTDLLDPSGRVAASAYSLKVPGRELYAVGPLMGDNFVRFITGHALGVVHDVLRTDK